MKFKLDENLGVRGFDFLTQAGYDIATVADQGLNSATDRELIAICKAEDRCLVTLDLDFANPLLFKPSDFSGIAILRLPSKPKPSDVTDALQTLLLGLDSGNITGKLWIVQRGKIREHQERDITE